jgi:hypothetical protein
MNRMRHIEEVCHGKSKTLPLTVAVLMAALCKSGGLPMTISIPLALFESH